MVLIQSSRSWPRAYDTSAVKHLRDIQVFAWIVLLLFFFFAKKKKKKKKCNAQYCPTNTKLQIRLFLDYSAIELYIGLDRVQYSAVCVICGLMQSQGAQTQTTRANEIATASHC